MKLPPPDDPSWKRFGEEHRHFMALHPNLAKSAAKQFLAFAELREQIVTSDHESAEPPPASEGQWVYVTNRYRITRQQQVHIIDTPWGNIEITTFCKNSNDYGNTESVIIFSWHTSIGSSYQILVDFLALETLLPLIEPIPLGSASANGFMEIPLVNIVPTQPLGFQLILADVAHAADTIAVTQPAQRDFLAQPSSTSQSNFASTFVKRRLSLNERKDIVRLHREIPRERYRPPIAHCMRSQKSQTVSLLEDRGAGGRLPFPQEQPLPVEWFDGHTVVLKFHPDRALGIWYVSRYGSVKEFMIQLWGEQAPLGPPIRVGDRQMPLPEIDFDEVFLIEIYFTEDNNER